MHKVVKYDLCSRLLCDSVILHTWINSICVGRVRWSQYGDMMNNNMAVYKDRKVRLWLVSRIYKYITWGCFLKLLVEAQIHFYKFLNVLLKNIRLGQYLQYAGWIFQNGEFLKITLEIIMFLESLNSIRFGLVNCKVLCLHMFHQTPPWPSIVPFSPKKTVTHFKRKCR